MTRQQIAMESGLPERTIDRLSRAKSWDNVTFRVAFAYTNACGIDFGNLRRHKEFLKRQNHPAWKMKVSVYGRILAKINSLA